MYQELLGDASFFELLRAIDLDLAKEVREAGCPCGGVLHSACYRRKPRGGPPDLGPEYGIRESLCCAVEGCRRRATPPSVRFLGRKVFFAVVVVLVPILREGLTPRRFERFREALPVSRRTVLRWRRWWREAFVSSQFWLRRRAEVSRVEESRLPGSLLEAFMAQGQEKVLDALRWLAPLAAGSHAR